MSIPGTCSSFLGQAACLWGFPLSQVEQRKTGNTGKPMKLKLMVRASYTATHPCLLLGVFLPNPPVVYSGFSHHRVEGKQALALTQSLNGTQAAYSSHQLWPLSWDACTGLQSSTRSSWTPEGWSKQSPGLGLGHTCFMSVTIT